MQFSTGPAYDYCSIFKASGRVIAAPVPFIYPGFLNSPAQIRTSVLDLAGHCLWLGGKVWVPRRDSHGDSADGSHGADGNHAARGDERALGGAD
jgi:hypothetical protein